MGFKDAEWAYGLALMGMQKVVLVAVCHRTDDVSHETFVGQQTVAQMIGSSADSVRRALSSLESLGVIARHRRHGHGGFRTSDLIRVNRAYPAERLLGAEPTRQSTYKAESADLTGTLQQPTQQSAGAEEITQIDHSVITQIANTAEVALFEPPQTVDRFDEFYGIWPKKVDKPAARRAWAKAVKRATPDVIIAAAVAYRDHPHRPDRQYIRNPATWLNGDGWDDELPAPRGTRPGADERFAGTLARGQRLADLQRQKGISS